MVLLFFTLFGWLLTDLAIRCRIIQELTCIILLIVLELGKLFATFQLWIEFFDEIIRWKKETCNWFIGMFRLILSHPFFTLSLKQWVPIGYVIKRGFNCVYCFWKDRSVVQFELEIRIRIEHMSDSSFNIPEFSNWIDLSLHRLS
jgi:hypothetical protein